MMTVKFGSALEPQIGYWCKGVFTTGFDGAVENENMYGVWHVRTDKRVRERESGAL